MKSGKVTLQLIADQLQISKVTVSKALKNQPGVSEELRKRIIDLSSTLGYRTRPVRPMRDAKDASFFAFIVAKRFFVETDRFYTNIFYHLSRTCVEGGHSLTLRIIDSHEEEAFITEFLNANTDFHGIFVAGEMDETFLRALTCMGLPGVTIDFCNPRLNVDSINTDNFYASYAATLHLIDHGHDTIGFVGDPSYSSNVADRYYGYLKALNEARKPVESKWHLTTNDSDGVYFTDLALPQSLPTAFICHCDMAAYHMIMVLQKIGLEVPRDTSLISFDNTVLGQKSNPPLTTIDNIDTRALADAAYERMLWRLANPASPKQRTTLDTCMIERDSVRSMIME